jgi:sulfite exporter TauE/SafE
MVWTAFIIGFAGSLHCLGMCSPLAMAVTNRSSAVLFNRLLYNSGRILTYGISGGLIASVGLAFPLIRYQNILSILLGLAMLIIGLTGISAIRLPLVTPALAKASTSLKSLFAKFLSHRNYGSSFLLGSLNGVLPCGLSFLALTYCFTLSGPIQGFTFMACFGIGTLPVMLGFTSIFHWLLMRLRFRMGSVSTIMLILSGLLLIARVFLVHLPESKSIHEGVVDIVLCR